MPGGRATGDDGDVHGGAVLAQVGPEGAVLVGPAPQFAFGATPEPVRTQLRTRTWSTTRPFPSPVRQIIADLARFAVHLSDDLWHSAMATSRPPHISTVP